MIECSKRELIKKRIENTMSFPKRIYTLDEFAAARQCIASGYKHSLEIVGTPSFKKNLQLILNLIHKADYYDNLRTYIRQIEEIDGISQLREKEASIWLNANVVNDRIEGARFIVQKTEQMKAYLMAEKYYEQGELFAVKKSVAFLQYLRTKSISEELKKKCDTAIKLWTVDSIL